MDHELNAIGKHRYNIILNISQIIYQDYILTHFQAFLSFSHTFYMQPTTYIPVIVLGPSFDVKVKWIDTLW